MSGPTDHPYSRCRNLAAAMVGAGVTSTAWRVGMVYALDTGADGVSDLTWHQVGELTGLGRSQVAEAVAELRRAAILAPVGPVGGGPDQDHGVRYRVLAMRRDSSTPVRESARGDIHTRPDSRIDPVRIPALTPSGNPDPPGNDPGKDPWCAVPIVAALPGVDDLAGNRSDRRRAMRARGNEAAAARFTNRRRTGGRT